MKASLTHRIIRLDRRLQRLEAENQRFTWYRLGTLLAGAVLTWAASTFGGALWGWATAGLALAGFLAVVLAHRRLDRWVTQFTIWRDMQRTQLARLTLDWEHIPLPPDSASQPPPALALDLDLTGPRSLHHLLDVTISQRASGMLAGWLTQGQPDLQALARRQDRVRALAPLRRFRQRLLLAARLASEERLDDEDLLRWLEVDYPTSWLRRSLPVACVAVATNLTLFLLNSFGLLPPYWILSLTAYAVLYFLNAQAMNPFLDALVRLNRELERLKALFLFLETSSSPPNPVLQDLLAPFRAQDRQPSFWLRRVQWATAGVGLRMNPVLSFMVNLLLPWDFFFAWLGARYRQGLRSLFPVWLETLHELEALASLANYAHLNPGTCFPEILEGGGPAFQAKGIGHPLIPPDRRVCNDFSLNNIGDIAVITGSNMTGKTTFIKAIGVNMCLAYAGAPVVASQLRTRPFRLHTCIRITDSITDGYSYFYAEVKCLGRLLDHIGQQSAPPVLYLIDEIFRGTNHRERLLGGRAFLQAIVGGNGVGLLATHDLELASLAGENPSLHNYHFEDQVQDGKLTFDYQLEPGPSRSTNALRIMALEGLPTPEAPNEDR